MQHSTLSDSQLIYTALHGWANHLETGIVSLSAKHARAQGKTECIHVLNETQLSLISRLRKLADTYKPKK